VILTRVKKTSKTWVLQLENSCSFFTTGFIDFFVVKLQHHVTRGFQR